MGTDAIRDAGRKKKEGKTKEDFFHFNSLLSGGWEGRYYRPPRNCAFVISIYLQVNDTVLWLGELARR